MLNFSKIFLLLFSKDISYSGTRNDLSSNRLIFNLLFFLYTLNLCENYQVKNFDFSGIIALTIFAFSLIALTSISLIIF